MEMPQHIVVTEYNPKWPEMFERESEKIKQILGANCASIYHIGSTSVEGLAAKPIIDIMPVVKDLESVDLISSEFEAIGYESVSYTHLQLGVAALLTTSAVVAYAPFLLLFSLITGTATGLVLRAVLPALNKISQLR